MKDRFVVQGVSREVVDEVLRAARWFTRWR